MLIISTALYYEAQSLISCFNMKKDSSGPFQVFESSQARLVITGIGCIQSAMAVSFLLTRYPAGAKDIFINTGICGSVRTDIPIGSIILCKKIIHFDTKKEFLPETKIRHPFLEGVLESCSRGVSMKDRDSLSGDYIDMEAYGAALTASRFLTRSQIFFIKIVSDFLTPDTLTPELTASLVNSKSSKIAEWGIQQCLI